jgi:hypothetical protein
MRRLVFFLTLLTLAVGVRAQTDSPSPAWPTLEEQLSRDRVIPGSALEAFIRDNQDFGLLRPEEAKDKIPVPAWLRVAWRKEHPEMVYPADDPTGGYPFVLKEIHEWMETHQNLRAGDPTSAKGMLKAIVEAATAGLNLRISGAATNARSESDIRVNYWDTDKIISASNNIGGNGRQAQFFSTDGGATWGQTFLPLTAGDAFHSDPTVDWTSDGTAWSTTIGIAGGQLRMRSYKSVDNGATWTFDATFSGAHTSADKQIMWVDHSDTSPFKNNIYVCWHNGQPQFVNRRTGPAGSWGTPLQISGAESTGTAIGCDIKSNSSGDVFAFWPTTGNRRIIVSKSTNGGVSYGPPVVVTNTAGSFDIGVPSFNNRRILIYVSGGAYKTATKNNVYASWGDLSKATGCTAPGNEPGSNVASNCKARVWFSRSTDGGATWSTPVKINDQAGRNDQFNHWLVVDETTGQLAIIYYDTVDDAGRKKVHVYYQASFDDGSTWSTPLRVTTAQTDETVGGADSGNQYGDYNSLSGYAGTFFPSWTDRRNNAREEIWTAAIDEAVCTTKPFYSNGFETGTGLSNWSRGTFVGGGITFDWRGIQTCTANTGTKIFRFGNNTCTTNYSNNNFSFALANGPAGVSIPAGAKDSRLSFWHRRSFEAGADGGTLAVAVGSDPNYYFIPASAILSGATYDGTSTAKAGCTPPAGSAGRAIFTGAQPTFVETVVDLDAACNLVPGNTGGCAGKAVRVAFVGISDCTVTDDGWFLDDVTVTACTVP